MNSGGGVATVGRQLIIISSLLVAAGVYVVLVFFPIVANMQIIGYTAQHAEDELRVKDVFANSPAYESGLKQGDAVLTQAEHSLTEWYQWYTTDMGTYTNARNKLSGKSAAYTIARGSTTRQLEIHPRPLTSGEVLSYYGVRIFLIVFIFGLAVYIVVSRTRERSAFLTCLCFCFAVIWFASDQPYWPQFSSPLIRHLGKWWSNLVDLVEIFSIQTVLGILLHIALLFPRESPVLEKKRWLPVLVYVAALMVPAIILLIGDGDLANRIRQAYMPRLYINTILIVLIAVLMVDSYRRCDSPASKEQARWIVVAMAVMTLAHLVFWNIPTLLTGNALVSNYNWMLLTVVLLPISLTMSITNHELFGIRGMIRGRIRLLETLLGREKRLVGARDANIQNMQQEIRQLKEALDEYTRTEQYEAGGLDPKLEKLEHQFPELKDIRQQRLIGVSPLWKSVFEQAAIASRGPGPVLIVGDSGTGKTDLAWAVHRFSERKDQIYKEVSCAQFEHADPAFALGRLFGIGSGHGLPNVAKEGKPGLLEECDGGTLLLDDFDRLPMNVQDLLLYPLEGKPFDPGIGSGPSRSVSIKFIFATNRDPEELVEKGAFRSDVLARMMTRIDIPALRDRKEDIPFLVEHLTRRLADELGHDISVVSPKALNLLTRFPYDRGNVRELKAELQKAISKAALEEDDVLRAGYLSENIRLDLSADKVLPRRRTERVYKATELEDSVELEVLRRHKFQVLAAEEELGYSHKSKTLSNHLRGMCMQALAECDWDTDSAARSLAGDNNTKEVSKLQAKMERFLARIDEHVRNNTQDKLFNNLPAAYHDALTKTIVRFSR